MGSAGAGKRDAGRRWELAGKEEGRGTWDRNQRALGPQGYSQIPQELGVRALGSHRRLLPGVEEERPEARGRSWGQVWVDPNHGQWCLKPLVSQGSSGLCPLPGPGRQLLAGAPVPCRELEGASRGPRPCPLGLTLREKGQRNSPYNRGTGHCILVDWPLGSSWAPLSDLEDSPSAQRPSRTIPRRPSGDLEPGTCWTLHRGIPGPLSEDRVGGRRVRGRPVGEEWGAASWGLGPH